MSSDSQKIIFIGPKGGGGIPTNGASIKNYHIVNRLRDYFDKLIIVDTEYWKKNLFILLRLLIVILFNPKAKYIVSLNNMSSYRVISFLNMLHHKRSVYYWVIGGSIADWIEEGLVSRKAYNVVDMFLVEGKAMLQTLSRCGFDNAIYVPNFKRITKYPEKGEHGGVLKFVFLSRIDSNKGCDYIISVAKRLNEKYQDRYLIDFYGNIASDYKDFQERVDSIPNLNNKGFIDLRDKENYSILSQYDAMLFPTFWDGEGFPGVIVDAFVAGLPVIASDWHLNKEIVTDGETGLIINPRDEESLYSAMEKCIVNPDIIRSMAGACQREAKKYDIDTVLTSDLYKSVGLI